MSLTEVVAKIQTHIFTLHKSFHENRTVYKMVNYFKSGRATDDNMAHAHCMLDK